MTWSRISRRQLPTHSLRDAILPGSMNTRALSLQTRGYQEGDHIAIKFGVVIQDGIAIRTSLGKRLTQLLHHVECDDHLTMVDPKGEPALARFAATLEPSQISGARKPRSRASAVRHGSLSRHAVDEAPNLITYSRPAASGLRAPTPVTA